MIKKIRCKIPSHGFTSGKLYKLDAAVDPKNIPQLTSVTDDLGRIRLVVIPCTDEDFEVSSDGA